MTLAHLVFASDVEVKDDLVITYNPTKSIKHNSIREPSSLYNTTVDNNAPCRTTDIRMPTFY